MKLRRGGVPLNRERALETGRGNVDWLAGKERMGDGLYAQALRGMAGVVEVVVGIVDEDVVVRVRVQQAGVQRGLLVGRQTEDL